MKKVLLVILILILVPTITFADEWFTPTIQKVMSLGIMQGDERGFRPQDNITRAEVAQVVVNLLDGDMNTVSRVIPSTVQIQSDIGLGSGVYVSKTHILTAQHVLGNNLTVTTYDGKQTQGKVVKQSSLFDLALIEVSVEGKPIVVADNVTQGETVFVVGNPLSLNKSVSKGIVSSTDRVLGSRRVIQTDSAINPGNSGGAMVNTQGELIGIVDSKYNAEGLGFAIHYKVIQNFLKGGN